MYPVTISQSASLSTERRRNPRHRAPSIIYVQLSSGNGGIVVNLGMNGVAFHAAQKVTAEKNSTLNVRLRGSGLNADFEGELVWLGATQKEAGICFKNLSANAQQDIAHWIAREAQVFESVEMENRSRPNVMPAMPGTSATGEKSVPHSLANALAMSRTMPADSPSSADANESYLRAPLDSAPGMSGAAPLLEIVPPIQYRGVPADELDEHLPSRDADSSALAEQSRVGQPLHDQGLFEPVPIDRPYQFPASYSSPVVQSKKVTPPIREELPAASAEPPVKSELDKTEGVKPLPGERVSLPPDNRNEGVTSEKSIPPTLLVARKGGTGQRKLMFAGAGVACVGVFALTFGMGVTHVKRFVPRTAGIEAMQQTELQPTAARQSSVREAAVKQPAVQQSSERPPTEQQPTAPPVASPVRVEPPQAGPVPAPPTPSATVPPLSHQTPASVLANLANNLLGIESDATTPITDEQVGVQVWTSQRSGYYYCTDSDYYRKVQPGTFMAQEDALQSGYRPRLRQFCN